MSANKVIFKTISGETLSTQLTNEDGVYVRRDIPQAKDWNEDLKNQTQQREGISLCL